MTQTAERLLTPLNEEALVLCASYANIEQLDCVRAPRGLGVYASTGPNFSHTVFGRDSLVVGEKVYKYDRLLAEDIILTLASQQGTANTPLNEEELGKIIHEYRTADFGGILVPDDCIAVMHKLLGERDEPVADVMRHYDTADATPLYIRFIKKFTDEYGDDFLDRGFINKDGEPSTIRESLQSATNWLTDKLLQRDDHMLSYRRSNSGNAEKEIKGSIENQIWKDSRTSHLFNDGTLPDFGHDVVSIELQGYAYDALKSAAYFFPDHAEEYLALAADVQRSTIEKLWMPEEQFFAQGLATHQSREERPLDTLASDAGLLLDSHLLKDLPEWARDMYVDGITNMIMGPEFLTSVGTRCRALRHASLLPYADYHGSLAVWAKETSEIARGLESFGKITEAMVLYKSLLESPQVTGQFYELTYVDLDGTPYYDPREGVARFSSSVMGEPLPVPEPGQAWTIAAAIEAARRLLALYGSYDDVLVTV